MTDDLANQEAQYASDEELRAAIDKGLADAGIDPKDSNISKAVEIALRTAVSAQVAKITELKGRMEYVVHRMETLDERVNKVSRTVNKSSLTTIAYAIGGGAALGMLVTGFEQFYDALIQFLQKNHSIGMLISPAFADTGIDVPSPTQITPVIVYGIFLVLTLAYAASLCVILFGKETRDKTFATDLAKTLTAFFIGAVSGKIL
jgi:hypothetical protein